MEADRFLFSIFYEKYLSLWLMKKIKNPQNEDLNILMVARGGVEPSTYRV